MDELDAGQEVAPVAHGLLGDLAKRREEIAESQVFTAKVPRWERPEVFVKFRPIPHDVLRRSANAFERVAKEKDVRKQAQMDVDLNADLLINACIEIVAIPLPGAAEVGLGPGGAITRFDPEAAISLGLPPEASARAVCRALFIADGDLLATARALGDWSGYREDAVDGQLEGES